jgi:mannose-6-phosphate isomerase-like protein (cupin superfamily)
MTGIEKYTAPGILEEYCLGLLPAATAAAITAAIKQYPELLQKIKAIENALLEYSITATVKQPLKEKILASLENLPFENKIDLNNPPAINRNSNLQEWNNALGPMTPDKDYGNIKVRFIKDTPELQLCIAWLQDTLDEDEHHADEFAESFFILEGSCACNIGGEIIHLKAGDYLDIPFNTHHTIKSTSADIGYVKAIIQRKKTAA